MPKKVNGLSFWGHLDELRERLFKSGVAIVLFSIIAYQFKDKVLGFLVKPVGSLVFTSPSEAFVLYMTISIICGFLLSLPVVLFQFWQFVAGALKENERRFVYSFGPFSLILFMGGVVFAYYLVVPVALTFLMSFQNEHLVPMITVHSYISFVVTLVLAFGVMFEFPLVILFFTKIGITTPAFLIQKRRHAIVLIFIVSAIVTPPDIISQFMMAFPLMVLYEISIIVSKMITKETFSYES